MLIIDDNSCLVCVGCLALCPETALYHDLVSLKVRQELCSDCRFCVQFCPVEALSIGPGTDGDV
ncbi:MAG: ferredoxin [FCB group bacterium]|nr:ferredoxin [FCB group bacterium]